VQVRDNEVKEERSLGREASVLYKAGIGSEVRRMQSKAE
jgi:hypothetical protein